jgi:hypothetical protein
MISSQLKLCSQSRRMIGPWFALRSCAMQLPFVLLAILVKEHPPITCGGTAI